MSYTLLYHPDVKSVDLPLIDAKIKKRIKQAVETRLQTAPEDYGEPLRKTLKGYWKLRVGDYRVVFKVDKKTVIILAIIHRRKVYKGVQKRI